MTETIMVAMSGGVDSAAATYLAKQNAGRVAGVTMLLCPAQNPAAKKDVEDAAALCRALGIPHFAPDLSSFFRENVISPFIRAYENAETPNPCVDCNKTVKFGVLLQFAREHGYDTLATGHYARTETAASGRILLRRAADTAKDQTYVLYSLSQDVLSHVFFPLGDLTKNDVRALAERLQFPMAHKHDSQDICFIPDGDYVTFIRQTLGKDFPRGEFRDKTGKVLGRHEGIIGYTIGQRKGLGIAAGHPVFVTAKSAKDNTVTIGEQEDLFSSRLVARNINLIPFDTLTAPARFSAKVRYRQEATPARVEQTGEDELTVEFDTPQRAISPGQSLVLYDGDYVIGGGKIMPS